MRHALLSTPEVRGSRSGDVGMPVGSSVVLKESARCRRPPPRHSPTRGSPRYAGTGPAGCPRTTQWQPGVTEHGDRAVRVSPSKFVKSRNDPFLRLLHVFAAGNPGGAPEGIEAPECRVVAKLGKGPVRPVAEVDLDQARPNGQLQSQQLCEGPGGFDRAFQRAAADRVDPRVSQPDSQVLSLLPAAFDSCCGIFAVFRWRHLRLQRDSIGSLNQVLMGLVRYALQELDQKDATLHVRRKGGRRWTAKEPQA